ncbi:MAG: pilus assembly protein PilP [Gammaproteobacteria bacterium]|nr:MAG: pilus assembly protein PilP [Gammaproteobacteria bacterium]
MHNRLGRSIVPEMMKNIVATVLLGSLSLLMGGCVGGGDNDDLRKKIDDIKARPGGKIGAPPQIKPIEKVVYSMEGIPDPFKEVVINDGQVRKEEYDPEMDTRYCPDPDRSREVLEGYTLDSLAMVGVMSQEDTTWVLIRSPEGTVHRLKTGEHMGQNSGKITSIDSTRVELVERVKTGKRCKLRDAVLTLNDAGK